MARKSKDEFPLLTYTDGLVEDLRQLVPKAVKQWDHDAIHDARVATRRLKAALDVLKPILSADHRKPFARVLRKLRSRLGPLRDLDVMLEHVEHLATGRMKPAGEWLIEQMKSRRDEMRKCAARKITPPRVLARLGTWWGVREELAEAHRAVDTLLSESLHLQLDAFVERADAISGDPHELRIAGKSLRYTLEMAVEEGHRLPAAVTRAFKQMQDALGLWHDYVVLAERVMQISLEELLPHHDAAMQALVLEVARVAVQRSERQLARFSSLWQSRGQQLSHTIREAFPLTRPAPIAPDEEGVPVVSEPQTDHDPSGSTETPDQGSEAPGEFSAA
jgi:CHAD domain-containing protein